LSVLSPEYAAFLARKRPVAHAVGIEPGVTTTSAVCPFWPALRASNLGRDPSEFRRDVRYSAQTHAGLMDHCWPCSRRCDPQLLPDAKSVQGFFPRQDDAREPACLLSRWGDPVHRQEHNHPDPDSGRPSTRGCGRLGWSAAGAAQSLLLASCSRPFARCIDSVAQVHSKSNIRWSVGRLWRPGWWLWF
jgi:hypothetical protein